LGRFLAEFGNGAANKTVPTWVLGAPRELRSAFLEGFVTGDGYFYGKGWKASSVSKAVVIGIRMLAISLGMSVAIHFTKRARKCFIEYREVAQRDTWEVVALPRGPGTSSFESASGHNFGKVRSVAPTGISEEVFNFEVEEDNSYVADGIVVHNCQDLSCAGKRAGLSGTRSGLYRELVRAFRVVRPKVALLENVADLLSGPAEQPGAWFDEVLGDLAEGGNCVEWDSISAATVGAPHERERVWIVAHADDSGERSQPVDAEMGWPPEPVGRCDAPNSSCEQVGLAGQPRGHERVEPSAAADPRQPADAEGDGRRQGRSRRPPDSFARVRDEARRNAADPYGARLAFREGFTRDSWEKLTPAERDGFGNVGQSIWPDEPALEGMDDGLAYELDLIRGLTDEKVGEAKKPRASGNSQANAEIGLTVERLLRAMWEHKETAATSSDLYRRRLHNSVPSLPCGGAHGRWNVGERLQKDEGLRDLWATFYAAPFDQPDLRTDLLQRVREIEREKKVGSNWLERIKATGNCLVPQIPELIGRAIVDTWSAAA
jgi:site-specific DNA-cytosine methylase